MEDGATDALPLVAVVVTVVSAVHAPHVALSLDSLYWISYEEMALLVPPAAPLHERVTFPSASVLLTEQAEGAVQAVGLIS